MFEANLFISLVGYGLAAAALTGLLAPFNRRFSVRADAHWLPLALMAGSALAKLWSNKKAGDSANKQAKDQAALNEAERQKQVAANAGFLGKFGGRLEGPQTTTRSSEGGGSSVSRTRGAREQQQQNRQIVDPAQAALKAQLEAALGAQAARPEGQQISAATKAASREQIAARERAMRETLGAAAAQRGVAPGALDMLVNMPAQSEAAGNLLQLTSQEDETGRKRYDEAQQALGALLQGWKGSDVNTSEQTDSTTNQDYTNFDNSTMTDPNGGLQALYNMTMFSPGGKQNAQQIPTGWNALGEGAGALGNIASQYYANQQGGGGGGGGGWGSGGGSGTTYNSNNPFAVPPIDTGIFGKRPVAGTGRR